MTGKKILKKQWPISSLLQRRRKNTPTVKFPRREQAQAFLLIADLLMTGFSIKEALGFIATVNPRLKDLVVAVDQRMQGGDSFASSLRPYISADLYYQLLLAEEHGDLVKTVREVGKLMTTQEQQRKKLLALLQYPLILVVLLGGLIACLALFVFPELKTWQQGDSSLSRYGSYLSAVSSFLLAGGVASSYCRWRRWLKLSANKKIVRRCHLPIIGKCYRYYYHYYLTSILGLMLSRGMSLREICDMTQKFEETSLLFLFGDTVVRAAQSGEELGKIIYHYPFLPNELVAFMNKGATVEKLGEELSAFSAIQFTRLTRAIERLLIYVQPAIFGGIAIIIVVLYLSILLPIYHSLQGVY